MQAHAHELVKLGDKVTAYGLEDVYSKADRATWEPVELKICKPLISKFGYSWELAKCLGNANHDILHQHGLWLYTSIVVARWRRRWGHPIIISTQGMLEPWALDNSRTRKTIAAKLYENSNLSGAACIHCSEAEVESIRSFGVRNPVAVIPNGTYLPDLTKPSSRPDWLPNDGRKVLLFLGRLHPKKGIRETLEAWALLKLRDPTMAAQWRLVVAGWDDGGNSEGLVSTARGLGLDDVLFPGPLFGEQKHNALVSSDAFVLASHSEGLPMAVLEAWSYALPVFITRECNLPEGFAAGAAIEISTDPEDISAKLAEKLTGSALGKIGERGRDLVEHHFSWPNIAAELHSVYRWIIGGGERPQVVRME